MSNSFLEKDKDFYPIPLFTSKVCNGDAKRADKAIKFCDKCKRCWEFDKATMRNFKKRHKGKFVIKHYLNFPSYGKEKESCEDCKGNNE